MNCFVWNLFDKTTIPSNMNQCAQKWIPGKTIITYLFCYSVRYLDFIIAWLRMQTIFSDKKKIRDCMEFFHIMQKIFTSVYSTLYSLERERESREIDRVIRLMFVSDFFQILTNPTINRCTKKHKKMYI